MVRSGRAANTPQALRSSEVQSGSSAFETQQSIFDRWKRQDKVTSTLKMLALKPGYLRTRMHRLSFFQFLRLQIVREHFFPPAVPLGPSAALPAHLSGGLGGLRAAEPPGRQQLCPRLPPPAVAAECGQPGRLTRPVLLCPVLPCPAVPCRAMPGQMSRLLLWNGDVRQLLQPPRSAARTPSPRTGTCAWPSPSWCLPSGICFPKSFRLPSASCLLICSISSALWCNSFQVKCINKQILLSHPLGQGFPGADTSGCWRRLVEQFHFYRSEIGT